MRTLWTQWTIWTQWTVPNLILDCHSEPLDSLWTHCHFSHLQLFSLFSLFLLFSLSTPATAGSLILDNLTPLCRTVFICFCYSPVTSYQLPVTSYILDTPYPHFGQCLTTETQRHREIHFTMKFMKAMKIIHWVSVCMRMPPHAFADSGFPPCPPWPLW